MIENWGSANSFLSYKHSGRELRVLLTGYTVINNNNNNSDNDNDNNNNNNNNSDNDNDNNNNNNNK